MDKEILERLDRIEKLLRELVDIAREKRLNDEPDNAVQAERRKTVSRVLQDDEAAPDLSDVYDPLSVWDYGEMEADRVPQKAKTAKAKTRKRTGAPDYD